MADDKELLVGGVANAGAVTRCGSSVLRPWSDSTQSVHRFLHAVRRTGFEGVAEQQGMNADGREKLAFIPGDVPVPPYPQWVQSDEALASIATLLRSFHNAASLVDSSGEWNHELEDPVGGNVICHNDVCLENVVFRDGAAVALIDWDFAAPGRPLYDFAQMARMCVPLDDELSASRLGWDRLDNARRLELACDVYGLEQRERFDLLAILDQIIQAGGEFMHKRVESGDANFARTWEEIGGMQRFDRRRAWWAQSRKSFEAALD